MMKQSHRAYRLVYPRSAVPQQSFVPVIVASRYCSVLFVLTRTFLERINIRAGSSTNRAATSLVLGFRHATSSTRTILTRTASFGFSLSLQFATRSGRCSPMLSSRGLFVVPCSRCYFFRCLKQVLMKTSLFATQAGRLLPATCRKTIAPALLAQAACRETTTALAASLTATVPCARAVCYSAPTCTRLATQHSNWLSLQHNSYLEGLDHAIEKCIQGHSTEKYNIILYP